MIELVRWEIRQLEFCSNNKMRAVKIIHYPHLFRLDENYPVICTIRSSRIDVSAASITSIERRPSSPVTSGC